MTAFNKSLMNEKGEWIIKGPKMPNPKVQTLTYRLKGDIFVFSKGLGS